MAPLNYDPIIFLDRKGSIRVISFSMKVSSLYLHSILIFLLLDADPCVSQEMTIFKRLIYMSDPGIVKSSLLNF